MTDPLEEKIDHPLLGQRVVVTVARAGDHVRHWFPGEPEPERRTESVTLTGVLEWVLTGGDVSVCNDDGHVEFGWPALDIRPAPALPTSEGLS